MTAIALIYVFNFVFIASLGLAVIAAAQS